MFLQHLYQASFPPVKFQTPAPNANKQCILKQQHVYFVMSNDSVLTRPLGLMTISCNPMQGCKHTRPSVTWLISCSEIVFMILKYCPETRRKLQGSQIRQIWRILRQNCSDDSTEVTEGVTSTPKIFSNKQGATLTPEIFGNKHSFVLTFFATNTIYVNCKRCKP